MASNQDAPWQDKETLYKKYWVEEKSLGQTGEELGCSGSAVRKWLLRHGLGTRSSPGDENAPYRDPELLETLYWDKGLSTIKIADRLDCSKETVQKWMKRHGIETRTSYHDKNGCFFTNKAGYEFFAITQDYETVSVPIHRLLAIATGELDTSELRKEGSNVHHKNGIPWDNRPENIEALTIAEHTRIHMEQGDLS